MLPMLSHLSRISFCVAQVRAKNSHQNPFVSLFFDRNFFFYSQTLIFQLALQSTYIE